MEKDTLNITYAKNLEKHNFNSTINFNVDSKVNIKTVLNASCHVFDEKIDSANGKAVISGKLGVNVLYVDTDNITNTLTETQPFSETILDNSITSDCLILLSSSSHLCQVNSTENNIKVDCSISFVPIVYVNLAIPNNLMLDENTICKNSSFKTNCIHEKINTSFNYTSSLETQNNVSKILYSNSKFGLIEATAQDGFMVVEGKMFTCVVYESEESEEIKVKKLCDVFNIKTDIEVENLKQGNILDLNFSLDKSSENISTEIEDDNNIITINNKIDIKGFALNEIDVDCVEDLYSTKNEISLTKCSRNYICETQKVCLNESVVGEISLNKDEPIIEEIITNLNENAEITNIYIKNGNIHFEGIISSTTIYLDEQKELQRKIVEIPFVINTKVEAEILPTNHIELTISTNKIKARRGTIIEIEYDIEACLCLFKTDNKELIDGITLGKELDFSQYDYQIYIAKQNETAWELSKRVKCHPDELSKYNKEIPSTFSGGEKVIIKR